MRVLVIGASGPNAGLVVPELKQRDVHVRALVRDAAKRADAQRNGSDEVVLGDLGDPSSLRAAAEGMDGVFHINPAFADHEADKGVAMVRAAEEAGVRKFVFSGVYHPSIASMVNHAAKQPVEEALYGSELEFVVLQPAMFMQNLAGLWSSAAESARFSMPFSKRAKLSYVDYRDVAEAAAIGMTSETLDFGTFELAAPGMVDRLDIAELASQALGRTVEADESAPPPESPADAQDEQAGMARMMRHYGEHGFHGGNALVLQAILGRAPRTLSQFFEELAAR